MIYSRKIREHMWANGMPCNDSRYADLYRALIKSGLNESQTWAIVCEAYCASKGYTWLLRNGTQIHSATRLRNATEHPNGKDAEDLKAESEGRPSRWGTPEFHRAS